MAIYASANVPNSPRPLSFSNPFLVHRNRNRKNIRFRNLNILSGSASFTINKFNSTYRSMFKESNWPLDEPFLMANVLRKLTGILEVPGILDMNNGSESEYQEGNSKLQMLWKKWNLIFGFAFAFDYLGRGEDHMPFNQLIISKRKPNALVM